MNTFKIISIMVMAIMFTACSDSHGQDAQDKSGAMSPVAQKVVKSDAEWKAQLSKEEYHVTREAGTERAFTGEYYNHKGNGDYNCRCCGHPLFKSDHKYKSGTGWPSFYQPSTDSSLVEHVDRSFGWTRTEVVCARCDAHLGHVFEDGPEPTGMRYCINSVSLQFDDAKD